MKFALWGAAGYIASFIFDVYRHRGVLHNGDPIRLPGRELPEAMEGIIYSAGWPGTRNIDDVEAAPNRSELQNVWEPLELAERCQKQRKRILFIGTACFYDGLNEMGRPHKETDSFNFIHSTYIKHQAKREAILNRDFGDIATTFRIRLPFDGGHHQRNTLCKLLKFPAVWDKEQSYTWLPDLARAVELWEKGVINGGSWHVTQPGTMNNYDAVREHLNPQVGRISGGNRPEKEMKCPRSAPSLDSSKLQAVMKMTPIKEAWALACEEYRSCKSTNC